MTIISFLLTIPNECVGRKPTTFMQQVVIGWPFCYVLSNSPFTFYPSKGVNLELCVSSHEATTRLTAQLGRRCLDAVLHSFSHPAFPDTFRSICISLVEQAGLRSHSLKAKTGSQINHTDHKIMRTSP